MKFTAMKRIQLFEFEDLSWFPDFFRVPMTNYLVALHRKFNTAPIIAKELKELLKDTQSNKVIDLCSGGGGPMELVHQELVANLELRNVEIQLSDLYPNTNAAQRINAKKGAISYKTEKVDASDVNTTNEFVRTMICSLHHMPPKIAKKILKDAQDKKQAMLVFELSDNSVPPIWLWWISIPIGFLMTLFFTFFVRPMTWKQVVFTYLIPILPLAIAWDGAVSNARTYTKADFEELISDFKSDSYKWEYLTIKGKAGNHCIIKGMPL